MDAPSNKTTFIDYIFERCEEDDDDDSVLKEYLKNVHSIVNGWTILSYAVYKSDYTLVSRILEYLSALDEITDVQASHHVHPTHGNILTIAANSTDVYSYNVMLGMILDISRDYIEMLDLKINDETVRNIFGNAISHSRTKDKLIINLVNIRNDTGYYGVSSTDTEFEIETYIEKRFVKLAKRKILKL